MASKLTPFNYKKLLLNSEYHREWLIENNSNILENRDDDDTISELNRINHKARNIIRELENE